MTLDIFRNISVPDELPGAVDLAIVALSAESRCTQIMRRSRFEARSRLALVEYESRLPSYVDNMQYLDDCEYAHVATGTVEQTLATAVSMEGRERLSVVVDISCMSREAMARVFSWLLFSRPIATLDLFVCYAVAEFSLPPTTVAANEYISPVSSRFAGWPSAAQPTSLVVGLGYEPHKAEGAAEFLDPNEQWLFFPNSPVREFKAEVERNNEGLIERARRSNRLVQYAVDDPEGTYGQLELLVSDLADRSNPVLLPFGPKILFALALIQSYQHPEAGVWSVSSERAVAPSDRNASNCVVGFNAVFGRRGS